MCKYCRHVVFSGGHTDCALPLVHSIRDLGITVDSRLKFDNTLP